MYIYKYVCIYIYMFIHLLIYLFFFISLYNWNLLQPTPPKTNMSLERKCLQAL